MALIVFLFWKDFLYRERNTTASQNICILIPVLSYCVVKKFNLPLGISSDNLQSFFQLYYSVILLSLFGVNHRNNCRENDIRKIILGKETSIPIVISIQHYTGDSKTDDMIICRFM